MGSLQLVVEFGGGYGDVAAMAREMGFRGTHVVYDLLPALLLQQYFHRTSNWPSYLLMPSEHQEQTDQQQEQGLLQEGQEPIQERPKCISSTCGFVGDGDLAAVFAGKTVMIPASTPRAMMTGVRRTTRASSPNPGMSITYT